MNFNDIQQLLDRYWEGETTLDEERALKAYFASGAVDERHRAFAPLFRAIGEEQLVQMQRPAQVQQLRPQQYNWARIAAAASVVGLLMLGAWWWGHTTRAEMPAVAQQITPDTMKSIAPIDTPQTIDKQPITEKQLMINEAPRKYNPSRRPRIIKPDPAAEQAMAEIKAALALVSNKINKGKQEANRGIIHMDNVEKFIKRKES